MLRQTAVPPKRSIARFSDGRCWAGPRTSRRAPPSCGNGWFRRWTARTSSGPTGIATCPDDPLRRRRQRRGQVAGSGTALARCSAPADRRSLPHGSGSAQRGGGERSPGHEAAKGRRLPSSRKPSRRCGALPSWSRAHCSSERRRLRDSPRIWAIRSMTASTSRSRSRRRPPSSPRMRGFPIASGATPICRSRSRASLNCGELGAGLHTGTRDAPPRARRNAAHARRPCTAWNADLWSARGPEGRNHVPLPGRMALADGVAPSLRQHVRVRPPPAGGADRRSAFPAGGVITALDRPTGLHFHSNWPTFLAVRPNQASVLIRTAEPRLER